MAGRHRKPPTWRLRLRARVRSRRRAQIDALQQEVIALRATVAELHVELETARAAGAQPELRWTAMSLPLVRADAVHVPLDEGEDTAHTEIVLDAGPEAPLLDPRLAQAADLVDRLFGGESGQKAAA